MSFYRLRMPFKLPQRRLPRCGAKAKSTGLPCRRYVRRGWNRCIVHGAGTRIGIRNGRRLSPGRTPDRVLVGVLAPERLSERIKPQIFQCEFGEIHAWAAYWQVAHTSSPAHREKLKSLLGCRVLQDDEQELRVTYRTLDFDRAWEILNTDCRDSRT